MYAMANRSSPKNISAVRRITPIHPKKILILLALYIEKIIRNADKKRKSVELYILYAKKSFKKGLNSMTVKT